MEPTKLNIKIIEGGRIVTVSGRTKGHKIYVKRITQAEGGKYRYEAEVDGYDPMVGDKAEKLFDKYFSLAKFKARL
jgi:hypothetical protein